MKQESGCLRQIPAFLLLENGTRFDGYSFGAKINDGGELGRLYK